ncbi:MAG: PEP-CTERM sorting domain-containing protein [Akkermansia muciniphila]|nr:PEP-CTERM sorting domain-containing protein [Akkermansia muciniphila]
MKGTLITLLVLAGLASAESKSITLPGKEDFTWVPGRLNTTPPYISIGNGATSTDIMVKFINAVGDDKNRWFGGTGQSHDGAKTDSGYGNDITITSSSSFTFKSRPALDGEYVALGIALPETAQSITLNFTANNKVGYSLWSYNSMTKAVTQLIGNTLAEGGTITGEGGTTTGILFTGEYTTAPVKDDMLFVVWTANYYGNGNKDASGNTTISIGNISVSYEVPEPATATLSLLTLAGLCVRRRRR